MIICCDFHSHATLQTMQLDIEVSSGAENSEFSILKRMFLEEHFLATRPSVAQDISMMTWH